MSDQCDGRDFFQHLFGLKKPGSDVIVY